MPAEQPLPVTRTPIKSGRASLKRYLVPFLTAIAVLALSVMLVVTIYFTLLDLQWLAFLLGVLFAAILSMVTQSLKAQWRLVRRSAQLKRQKELLGEETARTERYAQAVKTAELRLRTVLDGVPAMVFFIDREERCRYHNAAFEDWCGRNAADSGGLHLSEILDAPLYEELKPHGREALIGTATQYETHLPTADGRRPVAVKLLPYPVGAQTASGFYVFVTAVASAQPMLKPESFAPEAIRPRAPDASSEAAYLDAMEQQLPADEDPREYLLRAIEEDQFILLEQRIELLTGEGQPNLREVLLRLQEERERMLPPGGFFEVAERYDLMPAIDRWVVRKLLKSCGAMKSADPKWRMPLYCVNVSGASLRDRSFANHVRAQLQHWDLAGSRLCFEIHHGALAEQESDIAILMEQLQPLGCRFTVDGFGSHKISFAPFRELRFDYLKIDGSIISQVLTSSAELTKVKAIVLACRKIGVRTIAQFVEDDATRAQLKEVGVDYVQGFGIEKPGPLAVMAPLVGHLAGA